MPQRPDSKAHRWAAHPWRARLVRLVVYACPLAFSLAFVYIATGFVAPPTASLWVFLLWWLGMSLGATLVVSLVYRLSRRLLPLGALLELSLIFPDQAPSRFELALGTGTVESLVERLRNRSEAEEELTTQEAAEILVRLAQALSVHDSITRGHAERVRAYSTMLGKRLGLSADDLDRLNWAALLHDVGKVLVSREILNKPGKPTDEEWTALRLHPLHGEVLVEPLREWLGEWIEAVGHHHERWDGKGYPRGLAGEEIPRAGRIVAIADVFDVMTSARSYKANSSAAEARSELVRCSGSQFDARYVRAFVDVSLAPMRLVMGPLSWLIHAPVLARIPLTPPVGAAFGGLATVASVAASMAAGPTGSPQAAVLSEQPPARGATSVATSGPPTRAFRASRSGGVSGVPRRPGSDEVPARDETEPDRTAPGEDTAPGGSGSPVDPESPAPAGPPTPTSPAPSPPAPSPPAPSPEPPPAPPPSPTPQPAPNQPPSFTAGGPQSVLEDSGPQSVAGWASAISPGPADESWQRVIFAVSTDRPDLFAAQPALSEQGTLTYTPAPDAYGVATVSVIASDDGGTVNGGVDSTDPVAFSVTISPVNDRPTFTGGGSQAAISLLGAQTVPGWATNISAGPPNESSQSLAFVATVDNPGLFAVQPAISSDGTLTYTPRLLALGVATVTVRLVDSGGTANGGSDESQAVTFTITIV